MTGGIRLECLLNRRTDHNIEPDIFNGNSVARLETVCVTINITAVERRPGGNVASQRLSIEESGCRVLRWGCAGNDREYVILYRGTLIEGTLTRAARAGAQDRVENTRRII